MNDEGRMTKECKNDKDQRVTLDALIRLFGLRHCFDIRHSDFVIFLLRRGHDEPPRNSALSERMLMMAGRRQGIARDGDDFISASLAFVDAGIGRHRARVMSWIEARVGQVRQIVKIFIKRHPGSAACEIPPVERKIRKVGEFLHPGAAETAHDEKRRFENSRTLPRGSRK